MGKRIKQIFKTNEVAHVWTKQEQDYGANSGRNVYFRGPTIYSYGSHFPMAKIMPHEVGKETTVLVTTRTYGNTTSGHQSDVRRAIPDHWKVIKCENVEVNKPRMESYVSDQDGKKHKYWVGLSDHQKNIAAYINEMDEAIVKASRARQRKEWYISEAVQALSRLKEYVEFFGLTVKMVPALKIIQDAKYENIEDLAAKAKTGEYVTVHRQLNKAELEKKEKAAKKAIKNFREGKPLVAFNSESTLLRVKMKDGEPRAIETSLGIVIPIEEAKKLGKLWKIVTTAKSFDDIKDAEDMMPVVKTTAGEWRVDKATAEYGIKAGCHLVKPKEINNIVKQLNW